MKPCNTLAIVAALWMTSSATAQVDTRRQLSAQETRVAIETLLGEAASDLSEDPSCKADLSSPGRMSVAQGLAMALVRAATDRRAVNINAECFVRRDYPLSDGEEYCRLSLRDAAQQRGAGYGLVFVMNWKATRIRRGSIECY
jgi:hypothetical protein